MAEVAHARITTILHQHVTGAHGDATQRFGGRGLGDRKAGEAAAGGLVTGMQTPIAPLAARDRDGRAVDQIELQLPLGRRVTSAVSQQVVQYIRQMVARVPQPVQQRNVAQFGNAGFRGEAGGASQRQFTRAVEQGQMQQVRGRANATFAKQRTVRPCAGLQINQGGDMVDDAGPLIEAGRCVLHLTRESCRFAPCQFIILARTRRSGEQVRDKPLKR